MGKKSELVVPADRIRKCPICRNDIRYKSNQCWRQAERGNVVCRPCSDDKVRLKTQSKEWREEQSDRLEAAWVDPTSTFNTEEYRKTLGIAQVSRTDDRKPGAKLAWSNRSEESRISFISSAHTDVALEKRKASLREFWSSEAGHKRKKEQSAQSKERMKTDPEYKRICVDAMTNGRLQGKQVSSFEDRFAKFLLPLGWVGGEKIDGKFVDFVNHEQKLILECFGGWFHAHPQYDERIEKDYGGIHPTKRGRTPAQIREFDTKRNEDLQKNTGYTVHVVWDHEIKSLSDEQIIEFLKQRSIL